MPNGNAIGNAIGTAIAAASGTATALSTIAVTAKSSASTLAKASKIAMASDTLCANRSPATASYTAPYAKPPKKADDRRYQEADGITQVLADIHAEHHHGIPGIREDLAEVV
ncbi:hypothetical protein TM48_01426 [Mycobacterium shottsii]|nr:hypothetical protein TM48_01426 [Mycobacterium shottsii]